MKVSDIIRQVLTKMDSLEATATESPPIGSEEHFKNRANDNTARFIQIKDLKNDTSDQTLANSPNEAYAGIDAVTTNAGGGMNGPKHPSDIRGDSVSIYPSKQWDGN